MALARLLGATSPRQADLGLLLVRLWFGGVLAIGHGWGKLTALGDFTASVVQQGLPFPTVMAPAAALSELVGGLCLALGVVTRPAAVAVAATMAVAAFKVHAADPFVRKELALAYGVVALGLLVAGAGRYSIDARLAGRSA
jgi:putative oxidoreductase